MQVLWNRQGTAPPRRSSGADGSAAFPGLTVHEVVSALPRDVAYTTVLTTLRILEKKGYVVHHPHPEGGRAHVYLPTVAAAKTRRLHVKDLVARLFGGEPQELMVGLLEEEPLERDELKRLRALIDERLAASGRSTAKGNKS